MREVLELWDYRRQVDEIYAAVRSDPDPHSAWLGWQSRRDVLFGTHPRSAIPEGRRSEFKGLRYYPYDPAWRLSATATPTARDEVESIAHSGKGDTGFRRFAILVTDAPVGPIRLVAYWLDAYGGGIFLPFRDATNGSETYSGGRYLLDSVKGADLGHHGDQVLLDFNFAYHPSCVHDDRWSCPLAPSENWLSFRLEAGERI